jgi:hypothetical protein
MPKTRLNRCTVYALAHAVSGDAQAITMSADGAVY